MNSDAVAEQVAVTGGRAASALVAVGLAALGHPVLLGRQEAAAAGQARDPELLPAMRRQLGERRLRLVADSSQALSRADVLFVCGAVHPDDEREREVVIQRLRMRARHEAVVVNTCRAPFGSTRGLGSAIGREDLSFVSNPRVVEGATALRDFLEPQQLVVGADGGGSLEKVLALYRGVDAPVLRCDAATADLLPHATNAWLAARERYWDSLAEICGAVGADFDSVARCLDYDGRVELCTEPRAETSNPRTLQSLAVLTALGGGDPLLREVQAGLEVERHRARGSGRR